MSTRAQLGANIRAARKAAGLTGMDLAERLEVSAVAVSQFERLYVEADPNGTRVQRRLWAKRYGKPKTDDHPEATDG